MKLTYYRGPVPNFGDDLNNWLWPRLLPEGLLDDEEDELFVGIGSILSSALPAAGKKFVFGAGYGGYSDLPDISESGKWDIRFVRGPLTARKLGLDLSLAICDSAILLRKLDKLPPPAQGIGVAVIPHFESIDRGFWANAVQDAGMHMIDPRAEVETVLSEIQGAELVIAEAMHGAIVADALRVPWVPILPVYPAHHMKWDDWAMALEINLERQFMPATGVMEAYIAKTKGQRYYEGRAKKYAEHTLMRPVNEIFTWRASKYLRRAATARPHMSKDSVISRQTEKAYGKICEFVEERKSK